MIFTREDILKIQNALLQLGRKDSEFKDANTPLNSNDEIAILQDGINKKVSISNLLSTLGLLKKDDFINVSDRYDEYYIQLSEAITIIANNKRKKGLVITFQDVNGTWKIYQFNDEVSNFIKTEYWKDLFDFKYPIINTILPDEEDLTLTYPNTEGNSFIKLKDKEYDPENFSGMSTKILRKNIKEVTGEKKNILTQDDFDKENCIYEIRYNFDLNKETITIPNNCTLYFYGGSLDNGILVTNITTKVITYNNHIFRNNLNIQGIINNGTVNLNWFTPDENNFWNKAMYIAIINNKHIICDGVYTFSGEMIDCREKGGQFILTGNWSKFYNFHLAFNVKENNSPAQLSGVSAFEPVIEYIWFIDLKESNLPVLFTAYLLAVRFCKFSSCENCLGFTNYYLDYITINNVVLDMWNDPRKTYLINTFNYDYTEISNDKSGLLADVISITSTSGGIIKIKKLDNLNIKMYSCLGILFEFSYDGSYNDSLLSLYASLCHWETRKEFITNASNVLLKRNKFIFKSCFFYPTSIPSSNSILTQFILEDSLIAYHNSITRNLPNLYLSNHSSFLIHFVNVFFWYDSVAFNNAMSIPNRIIRGAVTPTGRLGYYYLARSSRVYGYENAQRVSYLIGISTNDRYLYNGGKSVTAYWSEEKTLPSNSFALMTLYINTNINAYVHVYRKDLDTGVIKYMIFRASKIEGEMTDNAVLFIDSKIGFCGIPWLEYQGAEEDIKYVTAIPN